ncbi:MAG: radical SAM family heme chaperone HemW [Gammaproteobacteria bacterium]|nr:radical SAM family heme chaperone HemW [Gammaproteobacteria bacterium]
MNKLGQTLTVKQDVAADAIPLSLYIHIPWCLKKCPYCDFNSHGLKSGNPLPEDAYINALLTDLDLEFQQSGQRPIHSIFIGGGTPSLFSAHAIADLLSGIQARCKLKSDVEITLEANPGTFEQARFSDYRALGINRLSIGIQSFNSDALKQLGRVHDGHDAIHAAEIAHRAGFDNFNLDLMFGLPGQSLQQAKADVKTAVRLGPAHISYYQLTLEPNTLFYVQPPILPDDDTIWTIQEQGQALLAEAGYQQYEISAYAQPEKKCQHNLNYWLFGDYIGIGAGAHGKVTTPDGIIRRSKVRHPNDYLRQAADDTLIQTESVIPRESQCLEFMMNALRLTKGFTTETLTQRTQMTLEAIQPRLKTALNQELINIDGKKIVPTRTGSLFLNDLLSIFM